MRFLTVLLFLLTASNSHADIALDLSTSYETSVPSSTTCGGSHLAAASGVTLALMWVGMDADETISSITYGGDTMTLVTTSGSASHPGDEKMHLYMKADPKQGTQTGTTTVSSDDHVGCVIQTFTGTLTTAGAVVQSAGYDNSGAECATALVALTLASTANWMVSGSVWHGANNTPITTFTNCTSTEDGSTGPSSESDDAYNTCDSTGDSGSLTHTIDAPTTDECAMVSAELAAASSRRIFLVQ